MSGKKRGKLVFEAASCRCASLFNQMDWLAKANCLQYVHYIAQQHFIHVEFFFFFIFYERARIGRFYNVRGREKVFIKQKKVFHG